MTTTIRWSTSKVSSSTRRSRRRRRSGAGSWLYPTRIIIINKEESVLFPKLIDSYTKIPYLLATDQFSIILYLFSFIRVWKYRSVEGISQPVIGTKKKGAIATNRLKKNFRCTSLSEMSEQNDPCQSSSPSVSGSFQDTDDDISIPNISCGESSSEDRKLGRRLSHLASIPHTPRVNGAIPDSDDATFNHDRLSERLNTYGLAELQIEGDGNCQFRAIADQLFRNPEYHKHVRKQVIKQLKNSRKSYEEYVPMNYSSYLKKMKKLGEWGDHITLQAAADRFEIKICVVTSFKDTCFIQIVPREKHPSRELWLSFWSEVHYNSLYGIDDLPTRTVKKKHWLF